MRVPITARSVALQLLNKVYGDGAYANLAMPTLLTEAKLPDRDSAFAQELGFSTIRWQLTYDRIIGEVSSREVAEIEPTLLNGIRLGVHQLLQMRVPAHAAINETVNLIRQSCGERVVGFHQNWWVETTGFSPSWSWLFFVVDMLVWNVILVVKSGLQC